MCNEVEVEYDPDGYSKALDKLVSMSEKEYYVHLVDINRHQVIVARSLLWLLIVVLGFDIGFIEWSYEKVAEDENYLSTLTASYVFTGLSILSCVVGFIYSALAIPAFGGYAPLYEKSWGEYSNSAFEDLNKGSDSVYSNTLTDLLEKLDKACAVGSKTNQERGFKLRVSSIAIIVSLVFSAIAFLIFSFNFYL